MAEYTLVPICFLRDFIDGQAMRSTLSNVPVPSLLSFLNVPWRVGRVKQAAKPWVCQQCCYSYYNQKSLRPRASTSVSTLTYDQIGFGTKPRTRKDWLSTTSKCPVNYDAAQEPRKDLPSQEEGRRSQASKRFSHVMDHLQSNIFIAGQRLNDLTGYSGIEALKKDIEEQGQSYLQPKL